MVRADGTCRGGEPMPDTKEIWQARAIAFKEISDEARARAEAAERALEVTMFLVSARDTRIATLVAAGTALLERGYHALWCPWHHKWRGEQCQCHRGAAEVAWRAAVDGQAGGEGERE